MRIQFGVPQIAMRVRIVKSRRAAVMNSFFLVWSADGSADCITIKVSCKCCATNMLVCINGEDFDVVILIPLLSLLPLTVSEGISNFTDIPGLANSVGGTEDNRGSFST